MAAPAAAGYSGTPLPKKLGLKDGQRVVFLNLPDSVSDLRKAAMFASCADTLARAKDLDFVQVFTTKRAELARVLKTARERIAPGGMIWASWPKKASKVDTDITEDVVREEAFPLGLVDVKVCAVDDVWSGLKLMIRRSER